MNINNPSNQLRCSTRGDHSPYIFIKNLYGYVTGRVPSGGTEQQVQKYRKVGLGHHGTRFHLWNNEHDPPLLLFIVIVDASIIGNLTVDK